MIESMVLAADGEFVTEEHETLNEAMKKVVTSVKKDMANGMSLQVLETCYSVQLGSAPMDFYAIRDRCHDLGLIDGKGNWLGE